MARQEDVSMVINSENEIHRIALCTSLGASHVPVASVTLLITLLLPPGLHLPLFLLPALSSTLFSSVAGRSSASHCPAGSFSQPAPDVCPTWTQPSGGETQLTGLDSAGRGRHLKHSNGWGSKKVASAELMSNLKWSKHWWNSMSYTQVTMRSRSAYLADFHSQSITLSHATMYFRCQVDQ